MNDINVHANDINNSDFTTSSPTSGSYSGEYVWQTHSISFDGINNLPFYSELEA